jgi:hypothetical protein
VVGLVGAPGGLVGQGQEVFLEHSVRVRSMPHTHNHCVDLVHEGVLWF